MLSFPALPSGEPDIALIVISFNSTTGQQIFNVSDIFVLACCNQTGKSWFNLLSLFCGYNNGRHIEL